VRQRRRHVDPGRGRNVDDVELHAELTAAAQRLIARALTAW